MIRFAPIIFRPFDFFLILPKSPKGIKLADVVNVSYVCMEYYRELVRDIHTD